MNQVISEDINNLIEYLFYNYKSNYNLSFLKSRYMPNIIIKKKNEKRKKKKFKLKKKNHVPNIKYRCMARCWGGKKSVKYNPINKKWYYGTLCSRYKSHGNYCLTHYKQSLTSYGLSHGNFNDEPPHPHYNKYKKKIELLFNIKK